MIRYARLQAAEQREFVTRAFRSPSVASYDARLRAEHWNSYAK